MEKEEEKEKCIAEKKKAIFESTLELVKENGFHGTPMSAVAKNAGVAAGTIYHYFESKDALINDLHLFIREKFIEVLLKNDDENKSFKERFFNFWYSHYDFYIQHPAYLYFMEQFVNSPYSLLNKKQSEIDAFFQDNVTQFFKSGIEKEILVPMNYLLMISLIHGTIVKTAKIQLAGTIKVNKKDKEQVVEMIWKGLKKD